MEKFNNSTEFDCDNVVPSPNQEASKHSFEFGKEEKERQKVQKEAEKALKDILNRPAKVLATTEEITNYVENYSYCWNIRVKKGVSPDFIYGVNLVQFTHLEADGSEGVTLTFLLHELENGTIIEATLKKLKQFARAIDKEMLINMVAHAVELRKRGEYEMVDEDELNSLLEEAMDRKLAANQFRKLENSIIAEIENFASVQKEEYDPAIHYGIFLDTPELKGKFGKDAVGVTKYTLMELFIWKDEIPVSREEFHSNGSDGDLKKILKGWKDAGLLIKKTEFTRMNEFVKYNSNGDRERFYIVKCPRVYKVLAQIEEGANNE
ncbi:hypothetical protein M4D70_21665 [Brevibacillus borstelensis]|uniref:hypothetical protein n=1 Tax=Brevibacillus borstelensis TaxID=45462 RepID=UPI00203AF400|nr:hypothetical protein [Brevibacillus borstelensis]MCM3624837.1 hypothetical protein [Brevibacillus borstelensis]